MAAQNILSLFPEQIRPFFRKISENQDKIQEIRLRILRPICVFHSGREWFVDEHGKYTECREKAKCLNTDEMKSILNHICQYSMYAYEDEVRQGFLTVPGGHRVGIAGQVVLDDEEQIKTVKYISGLNIRIAHEVKGVADGLLPFLYERGRIQNLLIIAPPGCGKTTILRDIIRQVSDGNQYGKGISVSVVDERSELAGCYRGVAQNDIGLRTDILDSCPKAKGMMMMIRSMAPEAIAIDELGEEQEWRALLYASYCGTAILATMHGTGLEDYRKRSSLIGYEDMFKVCIVLRKRERKCVIAQIYRKEDEEEWKCLFQK